MAGHSTFEGILEQKTARGASRPFIDNCITGWKVQFGVYSQPSVFTTGVGPGEPTTPLAPLISENFISQTVGNIR
jgi:hypothetical protein